VCGQLFLLSARSEYAGGEVAIAKRYMHLSGATSRDFGVISVADRKHAAKPERILLTEADNH
jgi:hypothetical protein